MSREIVKCTKCGVTTWANCAGDTMAAKLAFHNKLYAKGWRYYAAPLKYGPNSIVPKGWRCSNG